MKNWVVVGLIAAVCAVPFALALREDSSERASDSTADENEQQPEPVVAEPIAEAPAQPEWEVAPVADRTFYDIVLLAGEGASRPVMSGTLGGLKLGMTRDEVSLAAPAAANWQQSGAHDQFPGARLWLLYKGPGNTLSTALLAFPDKASAISVLIEAWGEPTHQHTLPDSQVAIWLDASTRTRTMVTQWAATERSAVAFSSYTPIEELIAPGTSLFGFETRRLLGSSKEAVLRLHINEIVADSRQTYQLPLGLTEYASEPQQAVLHIENDRVAKVEFAIDYRLAPESHREISEMLSKKLGKPDQTDPGGRTTVYVRGKERITVDRDADSPTMFVTIEPR